MKKMVSIVFPVFNEEDTIKDLVESSVSQLEEMPYEYQVMIVNNASTDRTGAIIDELAETHPTVKAVHHPKNLGYAMSTLTGFRKSDGDIVIIIDGDGQHTVADVPLFVNKIEAGYDILFGWKEDRKDSALRIVLTKGLNSLSKMILKYPYNDINCGYRAVTRKVADQIDIKHKLNSVGPEIYVWGKLHGCKMTELSVQHFPREAGTSVHIPWALPLFIQEMFKYLLKLKKELNSGKGN